jgi:hypothetical protein
MSTGRSPPKYHTYLRYPEVSILGIGRRGMDYTDRTVLSISKVQARMFLILFILLIPEMFCSTQKESIPKINNSRLMVL